MIAWLQGILLEKSSNQLILNVAGVGYEVAISLNTFFKLPAEGELYQCSIQTIVREDSLALFGFHDVSEKALFKTLIKVSGIGPKVALGILSSTSCSEFVKLIELKDLTTLVKLPGIGKKTAERLIIELSGSLPESLLSGSTDQQTPHQAIRKARDEACQALVALGFPLKQAEKVMIKLDDGQKSVDDLIRQGLKELSPVR